MIPRASAIPPAATKGTETASATWGISAKVSFERLLSGVQEGTAVAYRFKTRSDDHIDACSSKRIASSGVVAIPIVGIRRARHSSRISFEELRR
jgi:hypothetical protein